MHFAGLCNITTMIGFTRLALCFIQCLFLVTLVLSTASSDTSPVLECEASQYLCREESRCISSEKVCNFVEDCLDGSDEWRCGSCRFEDEPESCGLKLRDDRVYRWYRRRVAEHLLGFGSDDESPSHYLSIDLNIHKQKYISASGSNWHLVYKPMVLFPELRPTDSKECRLSIRLLLTDHVSPVITKDANTISWPQVNVLISASNRANVTSVDLHIPKILSNHHGSWHTILVPIGAQEDVWTLEMIISMHVQSYLLHLSNFQFLDCRPSDGWLAERGDSTSEHTSLYSSEVCNSHQFKCEITGKCIDNSLVCDYGFDCGTRDPSDESNCQHYQARCDFEAGHLCNWIPMTSGDAWKIFSAHEEDQMMYQIHRPAVDHTFRSKAAGHYLILDPKVLRVSEKYSLVGPKLTLKQNAHECSFRLWYQVASTVTFDVVKSPHLSVGFERVSAEKLFTDVNVSSHELADGDTLEGGFEIHNMGWRRLQVKLLDSYNIDERVLSVLEIAFGNFDQDLQYYLDRGGYLALDDFSFSPGCSVTFDAIDDEQHQHCDEAQFFCINKTPVTGATCIPIDNYCDFKNDCGLLKSWDELASDEIDCPQECHFLNEQHCNFKLMDARGKRMSNEISDHHAVNEAFTWSVMNEVSDGYHDNLTSPGALLITSNSANFIENHMNSINRPPNSTLVVDLDTFEVRLPVFSVSHSNCTFSLDYEWINGGNNIKAEVRLVTDHNGHRNLLKTIWNRAAKDRHSIDVGLGHQKNEFSIIIAISHRQEVENLKPTKESFILHHYKFSSCSFFPGLIERTDEVRFIDERSESTGASMYGLDYLEGGGQVDVDKDCATGYFQCQVPIVCIPQELVCDMQQDCQGGADEQDCDKFHRYNLDQPDKTNSPPKGWLVDDGENNSWSPNRWRLVCGLTLTRRMDDSGPPFDHSRCDYVGHYLIAGGEIKNPGQKILSNLHSPLFLLSNTPEQSQPREFHLSGCRVVFYLYAWGSDVGTLRVLHRSFPSGRGYVIHESTGALEDRWSRIWIDLDLRMRADPADTEFSLVFQFISASEKIADAIAIDDISFSPACIEGTGNASIGLFSRQIVVEAPLGGNGGDTAKLDKSSDLAGGAVEPESAEKLDGPFRGALLLLVSTCGIALIAFVSFLGFREASSIYERRKIRRRPASSPGNSSFLGAGYSLDNLDQVQLWVPGDTLN